VKQIPFTQGNLPAWTSQVKAKDPEWDEKLRKLYPSKQQVQESEKEFNDDLPI
jgi:hypothetical protein